MVLEARDRVGGRTLNQEIGDGKVVEAGGQWIGPTQDRLAALARELGVETFPTFGDGEHLIEVDGERAALHAARSRSSPPHALADFAQAAAAGSTGWRAGADRRAVGGAAGRRRWDGQTFATWMRRNVRTRGGRALMDGRHRGGLGGRARGRLAAARPVLHRTRPAASRR